MAEIDHQWNPSGSTRLAAVIGSPVRHSRSPALANAAFRAAGLDWAMVAFDVPDGGAEGAVAAVRALHLGGLMVTMPHKAAVIPALDSLTPAAQALGAVNSISWVGGTLVGHNTDGEGLVRSLRHDSEVDVARRRCVVLGAGGAARSVVHALVVAGASEVVVVNRTPDKAAVAAALGGAAGRVGQVDDIVQADIVINATSVGMGAPAGASGPLPCPADSLRRGQIVVDLVYQPIVTPLLAAAAACGAQPVDGIGMLVHQAAISLERWTGELPELAVMHRAARAG
ncbi:MAG: shikimate dehydrogenase [Microthrixaceae bacterium]|nr:shikimate dehydrogenase [Microthrixaceae bacterium]